jgi:ABC-type nitrate/sulfonate/bicarbonate transport system substrate-binding protein
MAETVERRLLTVTRTQGDNQALKTGEVKPQGWEFEFEEVPVLVHAFRRMVRGLEFDISEMALTTYLVAKEHGARFTAIPAFLIRGFHHGAIRHNPSAWPGIRNPKDLEGHKVGVSRGYTVTTGVWARAVLQEEYGVDLSSITWVLSGDEHVAEYEPPSNVVPMPAGSSLEQMLRDGELAAAVGVTDPEFPTLIPDPVEAGVTAMRERGFYPINHLVVVKDELLKERPELGAEVFDAFARAKRLYVDRLRAGTIAEPDATDRMYARVLQETGEDPLPYGIAPNRAVLEELMRHAVDQRILSRPVRLDDIFAKTTLDLTG